MLHARAGRHRHPLPEKEKSMHVFPPLACAALMLAAPADRGGGGATPAVPAPLGTLTIETLPSGLRLVLVPSGKSGVMAYYTLVRVGSRNEVEPGHSGFAHLFEHMMFRGTETR